MARSRKSVNKGNISHATTTGSGVTSSIQSSLNVVEGTGDGVVGPATSIRSGQVGVNVPQATMTTDIDSTILLDIITQNHLTTVTTATAGTSTGTPIIQPATHDGKEEERVVYQSGSISASSTTGSTHPKEVLVQKQPNLQATAPHSVQQQQQQLRHEQQLQQLQRQQQQQLQNIQNQQQQQQQQQQLYPQPVILSLSEWIALDIRNRNWFILWMVLGAVFGFVVGAAGYITVVTDTNERTSLLRILHQRINTLVYETSERALDRFADWATRVEKELEEEEYSNSVGHPRVFAVLRESIVRLEGGYIHPDLGFLSPAPCGAARGVGMVRSTFHTCQVHCFPGRADEKLEYRRQGISTAVPSHNNNNNNNNVPTTSQQYHSTINNDGTGFSNSKTSAYKQEEVLAIIPITFQMTRKVALDTILPLLPNTTSSLDANINELDDAALLTLLLSHERGIGRFSRWMPYIATLPQHPMCGFSYRSRMPLLDAMNAYQREYGVDVEGWSDELYRASVYADRIAVALDKDYGAYLSDPPPGYTQFQNIQWSLCQVASRGTAGSLEYGSLRLIPFIDLINHDSYAGGVLELNGTERIDAGDFVDGTVVSEITIVSSSVGMESTTPTTKTSQKVTSLAGAFVVRSIRHNRWKPLRAGQELLINYNVPHYSPLDWFVSMGFVPPERWSPWQKIDPVLPRISSLSQNHYRRQYQHPADRGSGTTTGSSSDSSTSTRQRTHRHQHSSSTSTESQQEVQQTEQQQHFYERKDELIRQQLKIFEL